MENVRKKRDLSYNKMFSRKFDSNRNEKNKSKNE